MEENLTLLEGEIGCFYELIKNISRKQVFSQYEEGYNYSIFKLIITFTLFK